MTDKLAVAIGMTFALGMLFGALVFYAGTRTGEDKPRTRVA